MASMCRHVRISHPPSRAAAALDWLCDWDTNQILTCRGLGVDTLSANICTADVCCVQVDESSRQREEINSLLAQVRQSMSQCKYFSYQQTNIFSPVQVCDLQKRVQTYSHENDDLTANLRVYQVFIIYVHWIFMELQSLWLDLGSRVKIKLKT